VVAFDADNTLWHNEPLFTDTKERFTELLRPYHSTEWIEERLYETETENLKHYGYGIKSFTLSMIETAIELTEGRIGGAEIGRLIAEAKQMLEAPVKLLDGAEDTIRTLSEEYRLALITKGDLFDQESKLARSRLGDLFAAVEIVTDKTSKAYRDITRRLEVTPERFVMVGDSLRSDIIPVAKIGGRAIHVPYSVTWRHEAVSEDGLGEYEFARVETIAQVPSAVKNFAETQGKES